MKKIDIPTPEGKENIVKSGLNYSPNKHLKPCTEEQKKENETCHQRLECIEDK